MANENPIDVYSEIRKMCASEGWKILMERYAQEGDIILNELLRVDLEDSGVKYTKRDLLVHQLHTLGTLDRVLRQVEADAKARSQMEPAHTHIGV